MEPNPYVGPRPFERGDQRKLYGRERGASELQALISTEREVLVYAQSGAGKTSLLNARVIPGLEQQGFTVLPVARVGADLPLGITAKAVANVFVYSAMLTLAGEKADPNALLEQDLTTGLLARLNQSTLNKAAAGRTGPLANPPSADQPVDLPPTVLIFDQFEEIFTTHRERWQDAHGFFEQVRAALNAIPRLRVVFVLREEYLAGLDPFLVYFPDRLRARFHLELLGVRGAVEAICSPAEERGVPFAPGVAQQLVDSLRRVKIPGQPREERVLGLFIEPLQLQVVCSLLWASLPDGTPAIYSADLHRVSGLDRALIDFYEFSVRDAARAAKIPDREVRRWFTQQLVTPSGTRRWVMQGSKDTLGLPNPAVEVLEGRHILQAEARAGLRWLEIAHDGLVEPIQASNRAWERSHMTPLRATARRWRETGDESLLYRGKNLTDLGDLVRTAEQEKSTLVDLEPLEIEFYKASQRDDQVAHRRSALLVSGIVLAVIVALMMGFLANQASLSAGLASQAESVALDNQLAAQQQRATAIAYANLADERRVTAVAALAETQRQERLAVSREYVGQARVALNREQPQLSLLLALQSIGLAQQNGDARPIVGEQMLRDALGQVSGIPLQGHTQSVNRLAESPVTQADPTGRWLATVGDDGSVHLWDLSADNPGQKPTILKGHQGWINGVSFSPDGRWLATAGQDSSVRLWNPADPSQPSVLLEGHQQGVEQVIFSPDSRWLISASGDKTVRLWELTTLDGEKKYTTLPGHPDAVNLLSLSADGRWLASASRDGTIFLWDIKATDPATSAKKMAMDGRVEALIFSPDGRWLASAGLDQRVVLWNVAAANPAASSLELGQHSGSVHDLAFSPDSCWLASAGADRKILLWSMAGTPGQAFYALTGHTGEVSALAFSQISGPAENYIAYQLASGGTDHTVHLWDLTPVVVQGRGCAHVVDGAVAPLPDGRVTELSSTVIRGLDGAVNQLLFVANNRWLAGAGADGSARLWNMRLQVTSDEPVLYNTAGIGRIFSAAISPDERWAAAAGDYGVYTWPFTDGHTGPVTLGCETQGAFLVEPAANTAGANTPPGLMAAGCMDGQVLLWDNRLLENAQPGTTVKPAVLQGLNGMVVTIAFSPDGRWLAAGDRAGRLLAWPLDQGAAAGEPLVLMEDAKIVRSLAFDPQGRWLASADNLGRVRLWDFTSSPPKLLATFQVSQDVLATLAVSQDGRWLAAGGWDHTLYLWKMEGFTPGQEPPAFTLGGFANWILSVAFSPDGRWLAAGSSDTTVRQWDLAQLASLNPADTPAPAPETVSQLLQDHDDQVFSVIYTPDSRWLLSSSADNTLRQWDVNQTGELPVAFSGHVRTIRALAVSLDSQYVISASEDGTLRRWALPLEKLIASACAQVRRELRPEEIRSYLHGEAPIQVCPQLQP